MNILLVLVGAHGLSMRCGTCGPITAYIGKTMRIETVRLNQTQLVAGVLPV